MPPATQLLTTADTATVRSLLDDGAQMLEVLPAADFHAEHLPGAVNVPLGQLTRERAAESLDRARPVVVYCHDTQCDLSSRGAALLRAFGFSEVYDYTGSKLAWLAMGHPYEGTVPRIERAGALARAAATCGPDTPLDELPPAGPGGVVVVVDEGERVLGTIDPTAAGGQARALDVAFPGPTSVRPSITADELARSMDDAGEEHVLVTTLDGVLLGVIERGDLDVDR